MDGRIYQSHLPTGLPGPAPASREHARQIDKIGQPQAEEELMQGVSLRPLTLSDADQLVHLLSTNRKFLHGWMPAGDEGASDEKDRASVPAIVAECAAGGKWFGFIELDGKPVGALSMRIQRDLTQTAAIGYWVAEQVNGQGVASAAVEKAVEMAFGDFGLHKVEAFAREDNVGSCRVLEKNGFQRVGVSRSHQHIGGRWWDMACFQRLAPWHDGVSRTPPAH
ncbi:GNAT family N-acetyltransferase [Actinoplanes sp. NPDC051859]|uniref:GNAT family N-acetyltransferase n=1 Tax=Actinoplanes sp. NPDC051859 TaxID=3363909 RepID=UPI0037A93F6A